MGLGRRRRYQAYSCTKSTTRDQKGPLSPKEREWFYILGLDLQRNATMLQCCNTAKAVLSQRDIALDMVQVKSLASCLQRPKTIVQNLGGLAGFGKWLTHRRMWLRCLALNGTIFIRIWDTKTQQKDHDLYYSLHGEMYPCSSQIPSHY